MKKLVLFLTLLAIAFYAAWPAYSLYRIADGVKTRDETKLEGKIAWQPLRDSLRPPVTERVRREIAEQSKNLGPEGILVGTVASELTPKLVEEILDAYVTPKGVIKLANQGGEIDVASMGVGNFFKKLGNTTDGEPKEKGSIGSILDTVKDIARQIPGGEEVVVGTINKYTKDIGDKMLKDVEQPTEKGKRAAYGLDNIKSFTFTGPLSFEVGLSKRPNARKADITAGMGFVDNDWKLNKLVPRLD